MFCHQCIEVVVLCDSYKLRTLLFGAQGYQRFLLSKCVVDQKIAYHAAPADRASIYLVSAFPTHSTSVFPKLLRSSPRDGVPQTQKLRTLLGGLSNVLSF